jgi:hypothetical protein
MSNNVPPITVHQEPCHSCGTICESAWLTGSHVYYSNEEINRAIEDAMLGKMDSYMCDHMPQWGCLSTFCENCIEEHSLKCHLEYIVGKLITEDEHYTESKYGI